MAATSVRPDAIYRRTEKKKGRVKRLKEFRCEHYGQVEFRGRGYGFEIYLCPRCFSSLTALLNSMMRQMTPKSPQAEALDASIGIFCERCEERKFDGIVVIHDVGFIKSYHVREGKNMPYFEPSGKNKQTIYCKDCWKEIEERRGIVLATSRNIFIPYDVDDRTVKGLFGDRLNKTKKVFTLIPTDFLSSVMKHLPDDVKMLRLPKAQITGIKVVGS